MGEFLAHILVNVVLYFVGGTVRWFVASIWNTVFNTPKRSFKEYVIYNKDNSIIEDDVGCINITIGAIFVIILVVIIINL